MITGFVVSIRSKIRLLPSVDFLRVYPLIAGSRVGVPVIPPSAVTKVYEALVGVPMFSANLAPASKVMLPVVVATTVGSVGTGIVTIGVIAYPLPPLTMLRAEMNPFESTVALALAAART